MRKLLIFATGCAALTSAGASAQSTVESRVGRLENEMRAVQRKVFANGAPSVVQPEITADKPVDTLPGTPASNAVVDLSARVSALEQQMATLTGQTEENGHRIRELQTQFDAYRKSVDARLTASERPGAGGDGGADTTGISAAQAKNTGASKAAAGDPARTGRVAAVDKPSSGDAAEDAYLYGYRLWDAKLYPEAEAQLKKVVADYPKSRRASFAQNLLGRAYLDEGKPSLASIAFYENYKKMPEGERASDSLLYLGQALLTLKKPADACKVYGELSDVYGARLSDDAKAHLAAGRTAAKCG